MIFTFEKLKKKKKNRRDIVIPSVVLIVVIKLVVNKDGSFHILFHLQLCIQILKVEKPPICNNEDTLGLEAMEAESHYLQETRTILWDR